MGTLHHSEATLRFFGEDVVPEEITALLGVAPTESCRKGDDISRRAGVVRLAKRGSWRLHAERREPENLEAQIVELLEQLPSDSGIWASLSRYKPDVFCGIFMESFNDGLPLSAKVLLALGERGISLDFDIYNPNG